MKIASIKRTAMLVCASLLSLGSTALTSAPPINAAPPYSYHYEDQLVVMEPSSARIAVVEQPSAGRSLSLSASTSLQRDPLSDREPLRARGITLYQTMSGTAQSFDALPTAMAHLHDAGSVTQPVFESGDYLMIPTDRIIVGFEDALDATAGAAVLDPVASELGLDLTHLEAVRAGTFVVQIEQPENGRVFAVSRALTGMPGVRYAEPDFLMVRLPRQETSELAPHDELPGPPNLSATSSLLAVAEAPDYTPGPPDFSDEMEASFSSTETTGARVQWTTLLDADFDTSPPGWTVDTLGVDAEPVIQGANRHSGSGALYMTGGGSAGVPSPGPYPNGVRTWVMSPPLDLSPYAGRSGEVYLELWFYAKLQDPEPTARGPDLPDYAFAGVLDTAGTCFGRKLAVAHTGDLTRDPTSANGWRRVLHRVPPALRQQNARICLIFVSDGAITAEGVYIDDLRLVATEDVDVDPLGNDTYGARLHEFRNSGQIAGLGTDDNDMNVPEAWELVDVANDLVVAVIDSGVELNHPDLNLVRGLDGSLGGPGDGRSRGNAHGTACAGNVGAIRNNGIGAIGVAPGVKVMPIFQGASWSHFARAIDLAVQHGAKVLSNSWGAVTTPSRAVTDAIDAALAAERSVLFAAGNGPDRPPYTYETAFPCNLTATRDLICVGASSPTDEHKDAASSDGKYSWGSSFDGPGPDVVVPGPWSYTTDLFGTGRYNPDRAATGIELGYTHDFGGTSSSTPKVAGVVALMLSKNPDLTPAEVKRILIDTSVDIEAIGDDPQTGAGRVDAFAAVSAVPAPGGQTLTVEAALDNADLPWSLGGDAGWFAQTRITHDDKDALQSGAIGDNQSSLLQTSVTGPGELSFYWRVSSEQGYDGLVFWIDDEAVGSISGEVVWRREQIAIPAGEHTLAWDYVKDGSLSAGDDAGWLDQVVYTPGMSDYALTVNLTGEGTVVGKPAGINCGSQCSAEYAEGTSVTLSAVPARGWRFAGWSGACSGSELCVVEMTAATSVTATFNTNQPTLAEALDYQATQWLTFASDTIDWTNLPAGEADWTGQTQVSHDSIDAAQSGFISHDQASALATTVVGPGTLTFWWRVSSEQGFDWLVFGIDDDPIDWISGEESWAQKQVNVPSGEHTLMWFYFKDESVNEGLDTAWVDQVSFLPGSLPDPDPNAYYTLTDATPGEFFVAAGLDAQILGSTAGKTVNIPAGAIARGLAPNTTVNLQGASVDYNLQRNGTTLEVRDVADDSLIAILRASTAATSSLRFTDGAVQLAVEGGAIAIGGAVLDDREQVAGDALSLDGSTTSSGVFGNSSGLPGSDRPNAFLTLTDATTATFTLGEGLVLELLGNSAGRTLNVPAGAGVDNVDPATTLNLEGLSTGFTFTRNGTTLEVRDATGNMVASLNASTAETSTLIFADGFMELAAAGGQINLGGATLTDGKSWPGTALTVDPSQTSGTVFASP